MRGHPLYPCGNISKVKYFLPKRQHSIREPQTPASKQHQRTPSVMFDENRPQRLSRQLSEAKQGSAYRKTERQQREFVGDMDTGLTGITGVKAQSGGFQREGIYNMFQDQNQRRDFFQFLQTLKEDSTYQNTITMFTVMYYYQKKKNEILRQSH